MEGRDVKGDVCQFGTEAADGQLEEVEGEFAGEGVAAEAECG